MKELISVKTSEYIFNHRIYDEESDKCFAKLSHNLYELIYVKSGCATYSVENHSFKAEPQSLILIKPYAYHFFIVDNTTAFEKVGILFDAKYLRLELSFLTTKSYFVFKSSTIIENTFEKLIQYHSLFDGVVFVELFIGCTREIVYNLSLQNSEAVTLPQNSTLIKNALDYINKNLFTIRNIQEISDAIFVSKNYFLAFFIQIMNISKYKSLRKRTIYYMHNMDFEDIINFALYILSHYEDARRTWQERCQYLLCDEYQDVNYKQNELLKILSGLYGNLFVVGDDDQNIYTWRGSDPSFMIGFDEDFEDVQGKD